MNYSLCFVPQTSDPYTINIGTISLSNRSRDNDTGSPPTVLITRFNVYNVYVNVYNVYNLPEMTIFATEQSSTI